MAWCADLGVLRVLSASLSSIGMIAQAHAAVTMPLRCCGGSAEAGQEIGVEGDAHPAGTTASLTRAADHCENSCNACSICHSPAVATRADASNASPGSSPIESLISAESPFTGEPFHHPPRI